ncbi:MAG: NigD-like N-terminal domain-containing protein, partial [Prevotella conceptionensis]
MKQLHSWLAGVGAVVAVFTFVACQNDKEEDMQSYPTALVTVKPKALDNSFTLQLDDSTQLIPSNLKTSPYGSKEVRALVNYNVVAGPAAKKEDGRVDERTYVNINWLDSFRTKPVAKNMGDN